MVLRATHARPPRDARPAPPSLPSFASASPTARGLGRHPRQIPAAPSIPCPADLPSFDEMYRALAARDAAYEGVFVVGVKTTGIFCRPTCSARKPLRENVEFFPAATLALAAGYRPCKRCTPMSATQPEPAWLATVHAALAAAAQRRAPNEPGTAGAGAPHRAFLLSDADLRRLGVAPSTARRYFLSRHGMTFHAYLRARRLGHTLAPIRAASSAQESRMKPARTPPATSHPLVAQLLNAPPSPRRGSAPAGSLLARWLQTPLGGMLAVASDAGLHLLEFVDRRALETELAAAQARSGRPIEPCLDHDHPHLRPVQTQLAEYFAGTRREFDLSLDLHASDFQRRVWTALMQIPYGQTRSYAGLARTVGSPAASRAVGLANGRNQIAIVIPCHRVIRSDGTLCGYGGGIHRKRWLLDHELNHAGDAAAQPFIFAPRARSRNLPERDTTAPHDSD